MFIQQSIPRPLLLLGGAALLTATALQAQIPETVARINGTPVTLAELEETVEAQLAKLEEQKHMLLENALSGLIDQRLLELEAEKRGMDLDQLIATEVTAKAPPVTDAAVDQWYLANRSRVGNNTKEQLAPQIKMFLEQQNAAAERAEFIGTLRAKHSVELLMEPRRTEFDLSNATWKGPEEAPVTLVEFSDFQCPACRGFNPTLEQLLSDYPTQVRVAFLQSPLRQIHPQAQGAAEASLCARDQGKFWELHDALFADQGSLALTDLKSKAKELGLDSEQFDQCLDSNKYADLVQSDVDQAMRVGASGTPSVYINGRPVAPGRVPSLEQLKGLVEDELARHRQNEAD